MRRGVRSVVRINIFNLKIRQMNSKYFLSFFALAGIIIVSGVVIAQHAGLTAFKNPTATERKLQAYELRMSLRSIWEDNAIQTRFLITSKISVLPGSEESNKLLQNNLSSLTKILSPYIGKEKSTSLTSLLHNHFAFGIDLIETVSTGNQQLMFAFKKKYESNNNKIAKLLATLNSSVQEIEIKNILEQQLELTGVTAQYRKDNQYGAEVLSFEKLHKSYIQFSDLISESIVKKVASN
jgi:hypothetical protein